GLVSFRNHLIPSEPFFLQEQSKNHATIVCLKCSNYVSQSKWKTPLAIAVFGKPGTGKSFFVKEALNGISKCFFSKKLEFNLSQWRNASDIARSFHLIQDSHLDDEIPIAFFDEFDCTISGRELGWIAQFLMPIQDGLYVEGSEAFHVGKSVFVFAGGTAHSYSEFANKYKERREAKVPDFLSRLRAFVDVQDTNLKVQRGRVTYSHANRLSLMRRAIVFRSLLKRHLPQIFDQGSDFARIDSSVTDAFLWVPEFKHGVRSIEAIIQMSKISQKGTSFQTSALPTVDQLDLHVDPKKFFAILSQ
ncbi:MAG: AAA family ATPase, partial [Pirellulaceae bacterium]|nr:AAA family ATPase [Pirellulaceae bacterium]